MAMAMAEQKFSWYLDLRSGQTMPFVVKPGHHAWVTKVVLVDPASAAAGQSVHVAVRAGSGVDQIRVMLSAERPVVPVLSTALLDDQFWLERGDDESADAVVRFFGDFVKVLATAETETDDQKAAVEMAGPETVKDQEAVPEDGDEEGSTIGHMPEQTSHDCWCLDLRSGETRPFALKPGQRAWVSHAELVNPESAAAGQTMRVALRTKNGIVESLVLSAERNVVMLLSTVMLEEDFWLEREDDCFDDVVVRFIVCDGNVLAIPETQTVWDGEDQEAVLEEEDDDDDVGSEDDDDDDEEMVEGGVYEWTDQEDSDEDDDIDEEEEDEKNEVDGFIRVEAADAENQEGGGDKQILVLYRYTRFSAGWSDGSVEARGSTREHQLRFVAARGHGPRSLAWVGASLAPLIYPKGCCKKLRELWTRLASEVSLPLGAARIKVFVDVGILRPANCTQESKGNMRDALKDMTARPWPGRFIGMVLNLPEPMGCGHDIEDNKAAHNNDTDGEQRPAKRRRVVAAGDNCSVCFDQLDGDDIAAWPGCGKPHVFHGRCMELVIESNPFCPICRRGLYIERK